MTKRRLSVVPKGPLLSPLRCECNLYILKVGHIQVWSLWTGCAVQCIKMSEYSERNRSRRIVLVGKEGVNAGSFWKSDMLHCWKSSPERPPVLIFTDADIDEVPYIIVLHLAGLFETIQSVARWIHTKIVWVLGLHCWPELLEWMTRCTKYKKISESTKQL